MKIRKGLKMTLTGKIARGDAWLYGITFSRWFIGIVKLDEHPTTNAQVKK